MLSAAGDGQRWDHSWLLIYTSLSRGLFNRGGNKISMSKQQNFSIYLSKIDFNGEVLTIRGKTTLVFVLLATMLAACLYVLTLGPPIIIFLSNCLGILILLYGLWDLWRAESSLHYNVFQDRLTIVRRSRGKSLNYEGAGRQHLNVEIRRQPTTDFIESYSVELVFNNRTSRARFPLQLFSMQKEDALIKQEEWRKSLNL